MPADGYLEYTDELGKKYTNEPPLLGMISSASCNGLLLGGGDGSWLSSVQTMGKWYEANVHTYQGTRQKPRSNRKQYLCPLLGGKPVEDDCSSFVRACLMYFGVNCPSIRTSLMQPGSDFFKIMQQSGFQYASGKFTPNNLQPGDIICGGPSTHTEIYAGDRKSWSWGNVHDGGPKPGGGNFSGMPAPWAPLDNRGGYIHCWRKM